MRIHTGNQNVEVDIVLDRLSNNLKDAQRKLNEQVLADSNFYIPKQNSKLLESGKFPKGLYGNEIVWDAPYAHYQYYGEIYEDPELHAGGIYNEETGEWFSRRGITKVPSGRKLNYNTTVNPNASDRWFEVAKKNHIRNWFRVMQKEIEK